MATAIETSHSHSMQVTISRVSQLESIFTSDVFIHGIPWKVKIFKCEQEGENDDDEEEEQPSLAVRLICANPDKSLQWSISGAVSCKLLSFNHDLDAFESSFRTDIFDRTRLRGSGYHEFIQWHDLFNENYEYVKNDSIKLEIKIKTENPNDLNRSVVQFESVGENCECGCIATFALTVTNVSKLMAVRSPRFNLRGLSWNIAVGKDGSSNLFALLDFDEPKKDISCKVTWSIKLVSLENALNPIEKTQTELLESSEYMILSNIVSWTEMHKPENGFVNNDSITLQIEIKTSKPKGDALDDMPIAKRGKLNPLNDTKFLQMECPICFEGIDSQGLATTPCGHLFCYACITKSISRRATCPSCQKTVRLKALRRLYLPV